MGFAKRILGKLEKYITKLLLYIRKYPVETIEILLASFLFLFGFYVMIPQEFLPSASVYQHNIIKFIFGGLMTAPAGFLLYHFFSSDMDSYVYSKQNKRRKVLFWISVTWFYMTVLRMLVQPLLPPIFLAFLALSLISFACYIRLIK